MSEKAAAKSTKEDDCDDCKRQRKENQALIQIYQRLQAVSTKTKDMRKSVDLHRNHSIKTKRDFHTFRQRVEQIPSTKKNRQNDEHKELGIQIAAQLLEKQKHGKIHQQNDKLKQIISRIRKESRGTISPLLKKEANPEHKDCLKFTRIRQEEPSMNRSTLGMIFEDEQSDAETQQEISSTNTSCFKSTHLRKSIERDQLESMNLWLYDHKINSSLEQELYQTKPIVMVDMMKTGQRSSKYRTQKNKPFLPLIHHK